MELGYMLVFLCCFILQADNYQLNKSLCEESLCLYLYEAGNTRLTWEQSHTACRDQGLEMLRIESSQTQTTVLPQYTIRLVWIGGRRSSDNTWRYMNWTEFDKTTTTTEPDLYPYCIHVNLCKDSGPQYIADNCDEKRSSSRVLCQYDKSRTGQCRSQDFQFGDKCYVKTQYDGSDPNRIDWYSGQTYCSQSPIQGDIAYSYLDNNQHINDVISLLDDGDGDGCVVLWLGVRRRIWFWKTDSGSDTSGQVIDYFNWFDEDTPIPSSDDCIYIDGDKGNKWRVQNCTGSPLNYFICMNASTATTTTRTTTGTTTTTTTGTTTTTTTATTTISTTATTTTTTLIGIKATTLTTTTTANTTLTSYKIAVIVTVLVCIVLMIVNIGQIVVWLRYRRQKSSKSSTVNQTEMSRNDVTSTQTTRSSALEQEVTQSGTYEEITVQTGQGHNT